MPVLTEPILGSSDDQPRPDGRGVPAGHEAPWGQPTHPGAGIAHADHEEHPKLRQELSDERRREMGEGWLTLEETAPTRPVPDPSPRRTP